MNQFSLLFPALLLLSGMAGARAAPAAAAPQLPSTLSELPGVLSWNILSEVGTTRLKGRMLPKYSHQIMALDNTMVKLQGFMMPLEAGEKQQHFLLTVTSSSCAYCLPAGPEGAVEVKSKTPIKFSYAPIILSGKIHVLKDDPMGLYYRLTDALAPAR